MATTGVLEFGLLQFELLQHDPLLRPIALMVESHKLKSDFIGKNKMSGMQIYERKKNMFCFTCWFHHNLLELLRLNLHTTK